MPSPPNALSSLEGKWQATVTVLAKNGEAFLLLASAHSPERVAEQLIPRQVVKRPLWVADDFEVRRKLTWGYLQDNFDGCSQGGLSFDENHSPQFRVC